MKRHTQGSANGEVVVGVFALAIGLGAGFGGARLFAPAAPPLERALTQNAVEAASRGARFGGPADSNDSGAPVDPGTGAGRREVVASPLPTEAAHDITALVAADPLVGELSALLADPALLAKIGNDEAAATAFLMHLYLGLGDLDAALDLAGRTPTSPGTWAQIAGALEVAGRKADAANAYASALEGAGRFAWEEPLASWAQRLAELDPARGLVLLEARRSAVGGDPAQMRLALALSMASTGREEDARATLLQLIGEGHELAGALEALARFDPVLAESELRRVLSQGTHGDLHAQLAQLLASQGRTDDALAALTAGFAQTGDHVYGLIQVALQTVGDRLDDATLKGWLDAAGGNSNLYQQVGAYLLGQEQSERALDYFGSGWTQQLVSEGYLMGLPDALIERYPDAVRAMVDNAASSAGDRDEVWGDIGDHYWRLGLFAAAEQAYHRANVLDPNDGEWTGKLKSILEGQPPF